MKILRKTVSIVYMQVSNCQVELPSLQGEILAEIQNIHLQR